MQKDPAAKIEERIEQIKGMVGAKPEVKARAIAELEVIANDMRRRAQQSPLPREVVPLGVALSSIAKP